MHYLLISRVEFSLANKRVFKDEEKEEEEEEEEEIVHTRKI